MIAWYRDRKIRNLLESQIAGTLEVVTDRQVRIILFKMRLWYAVEPIVRPVIRLTRFMWEQSYGRYRESCQKVHGSANPAPGGSTIGAFTAFNFSTPITQPEPQRTVEDAGIRAGEVVAYRCWRLDGGRLYSIVQRDTLWSPGEVLRGDVSGGYGVFAFKDHLAVGAYGYSPHANDIIVSGTVWLWGEIVEHEHGYRASFAAIRSIDASPNYDARALRKIYRLTRERKKKIDKRSKPS